VGCGLGTQPSVAASVRFADFRLDLRSGELRRGEELVKLQPQPAKVLILLVSRAGETITRQELARQVWGSDTFVDFEQGLNFAIRQIRTVLEDDADRPRFLETLPKRGYRFVAPVEILPGLQEVKPASETNKPLSEDGPIPKLRFSRIWLAIASTLALILTGIAVRYLVARSSAAKSNEAIHSIAVLPLVNLSADAAQEYFSDGLTDELITELAKTKGLQVISRTSVSTYKGSSKRTPEIARELGVDAIVEGTIERIGDRLRIRAQLIRGASDQHLWAESYDGEMGDLLRVESEVARDIAGQIGHLASLSGNETAAAKVVSVPAHEDYLRGRYYWNKRTEAGLRKGIEYFQKAIEQQPDYALAYAGIADSYIMLANWEFAPPVDAYPKAKAAALKALDLDPELAEAHTSLAYVTLLYEWNWQEAERRFRRAIAINPNYASAHHFYSICLMTAGRQAEALAEIQRAQQLDPLSLIVNDVVGWIYYEGRQYDKAIQQYEKTLEMEPSYAPVLLDLGTAYLRTGDYNRAIVQFEKARSAGGNNRVVLSSLAQAHALLGNRAEAMRILNQLRTGAQPAFISFWDVSLIYAALGEKAKAAAMLRSAADDRVGWIIRVGVDPAFDNLRDESDFQNLERRVGIPKAS